MKMSPEMRASVRAQREQAEEETNRAKPNGQGPQQDAPLGPEPPPADQPEGKPASKPRRQKSTTTEDDVALNFATQHAADFRFHRFVESVDAMGWHTMGSEQTLWAFDQARKLCRQADDADAKKVAAVVTLARADRAIAALADQWDSDGDLLTTPSASFDLRTGVERGHNRLDYITKCTMVAPAPPGTPHPLWTSFLNRVTNNNNELIEFLQRYIGYALTGHTFEHVFLFLYGLGANGKSVFLNTVTKILGDYAAVAPMELFLASKYDRHPTIAKLKGAQLVTAQETEKGRRWDIAKIKNLTSDDKLTGRFMRQDFFDFTPSHKLIIAANHKPSLRSIDEATRRRFLIAPFTVQIPKAERDPKLARKLQAEWPAILRWMIDGCIKWKQDGLNVPPAVRDTTDEYLNAQDVLAQWLDEETHSGDPRAFTRTKDLFKRWKKWCEQRNHFVGTEAAFADDLADRGFERHHRKDGRGFKGLWLTIDDELDLGADQR